MENKDKIKDILTQQRLLKTMINEGTRFSVTYTTKARKKGLKGWLSPKVEKEVKEEFVLKEPTLAVLDRASVVWLRMNTDGIDGEGADVLKEGFTLAAKHSHDMAECLAILVLGERYYKADGNDDNEIERLTELFYRTVKPSQFIELATFINATSNLVDFVNSMRLMKTSVTTTPAARVE